MKNDPCPECVQNAPVGHTSHFLSPVVVLTVPSSQGFGAVIPSASQ